MASGIGPIKNLPGKVDASNALVVKMGSGTTTGTVGTLGNLQGKVDSNVLVVRFA